MEPIVAAEVARCSGDGIPFRARPGHIHSTWAKTFSSLPELYLQPQTQDEIEKAIRLARACRRRITTTGCGHSPSTLTCTSSWLMNLDRFDRILSLDPASGVVVMQSGIRLHKLCDELDRHGLAMPNLGSINVQSIAGAISTGTHGSSLHHGLMSEDILALKLMTADGVNRSCSPTEDPELFRAALLSLGALGIITEVTLRAVPAFSLRWRQTVDSDALMFSTWNGDLWSQADFVRVWWLPHTRRTVIWHADKATEKELAQQESSSSSLPAFFDTRLGYVIYHNLLYLGLYVPRILPWVEWLCFGLNYGFSNGQTSRPQIQPSRQALLLNCLYSQYVNEWAIPLSKGPEVLRRLSSWVNRLQPGDRDYVEHKIPFPNDGIYVHSPLEVRVADTSVAARRWLNETSTNCRPYLDPTLPDGPTLYLNATLYRPYLLDPPVRARYYEAFEWLMRESGGRPHWAKNFECDGPEIETMYGEDLVAWRRVRDQADPHGMFVGPWHRRHVLGDGGVKGTVTTGDTVFPSAPESFPSFSEEDEGEIVGRDSISDSPVMADGEGSLVLIEGEGLVKTKASLPMEEVEVKRRRNWDIGGLLVEGAMASDR